MKKVKRLAALVLMSAMILGCSDESTNSPSNSSNSSSEENSNVSSKCKNGLDHIWTFSDLPTKPTTREKGIKKYHCVICAEEKVETSAKLEVPATAEKLSEVGKLRLLKDEELESYGITTKSMPPKIDGAEYYLFGFYPQTKVDKDDVKLDKCILNTEVDDNIDYFLGDDNKWYAAIDFDYYRIEPLVWRKLGDSNILLAEKEICKMNFFEESDYPLRKIDDKEIYHTNYEYSQIRAFLNGLSYFGYDNSLVKQKDSYLNSGILQRAFTKDQIAQIQDTVVDNSVSSASLQEGDAVSSEYICNDTTDKLFLLSVKDIETESYGFNLKILKRRGDWLLRSPVDNKNVRVVNTYGKISKDFYNVPEYIVPALTLR